MDARRSIKTKMWSDAFVEALSPLDKLVWVYLLTNSHTNMLGIYEITLSKISYETGIPLERVSKALEGFERLGKAFYTLGRIVLPNWIPNQAMNPNMWKSAKQLFNQLPNELITNLEGKGLKGFESLSKGLVTLSKDYPMLSKIEIEIEKEKESILVESEFDKFWDLYDKKVGDRGKLLTKFLKLSADDRRRIFEYIPKYKESQPDKKYRKNPESFLNQRAWEDELIFDPKDIPATAPQKTGLDIMAIYEKSKAE